jgi:hypothetical protein
MYSSKEGRRTAASRKPRPGARQAVITRRVLDCRPSVKSRLGPHVRRVLIIPLELPDERFERSRFSKESCRLARTPSDSSPFSDGRLKQ